jgi:hypothetical protein
LTSRLFCLKRFKDINPVDLHQVIERKIACASKQPIKVIVPKNGKVSKPYRESFSVPERNSETSQGEEESSEQWPSEDVAQEEPCEGEIIERRVKKSRRKRISSVSFLLLTSRLL